MNPRPKRFHEPDYILSLLMSVLSRHQETGQQELAFRDTTLIRKAQISGFQPFMTPYPELGWPPRKTWLHVIMQPEHIPFQDVFFSGRISEVAETLGMPCFTSLASSKPFAP